MQVLIIKMSSMGDVLHTLPAITDAKNNIPDISFDWIIEPGFAEIPSWHPAIEDVIPISFREWKKNFFAALKKQTISETIKNIRRKEYDLVIDAQGLLKSALVSKLARTKYIYGLNKFSAREPLASYLYTHKVSASWEEHAVTRIRSLFAQSLGYALPNVAADYAIKLHNLELNPEYRVRSPYVMLLHGTTWESKHWPDQYWLELALKLQQQGLYTCATWSNHEQLLRVQKIAAQVTKFKILPRVTLSQAAIILQQARAAVAVDTGFGHLAAALGTPLVSIYGATDPSKIGTLGEQQTHLMANYHCSPCTARVCTESTKGLTLLPPCMATITPERVLRKLDLRS